jgi:chemotaxis protein MotB
VAKKKQKEDIGPPGAPAWMTTYSDMVTLLLTFFILLISYSTIDRIKFEAAIKSLQDALGVLPSNQSVLMSAPNVIPPEQWQRRQEVYEEMMKLQELAEELNLQDQIQIEVTDVGMLIRMGDQVLFDLGKADLKMEARPILDIIARTIRYEAGEVLVSGHTDNLPIRTAQFPSNWELSTARALNVVKYFVDYSKVPPNILAATGYSEYRPVAPNDSPENRQKNRRVEFLVTWR